MIVQITPELHEFLLSKEVLEIFLNEYIKQYPKNNKAEIWSIDSNLYWHDTAQGQKYWGAFHSQFIDDYDNDNYPDTWENTIKFDYQ